LDAPIYLHPTHPPKPVFDACYSGFPVSDPFSLAGCGWHYETGIHVTRMILGGVFDQFPNLKIVIGHMGEGLPFWQQRLDDMLPVGQTKLRQPISAYLRRNIYYTFSAFNYMPNFNILVSQVGIEDRIMFSTDHPYGSMLKARTFLDSLPISTADRELIAHGNAEKLFKM
jgi:predicted TIM-barrel fold metal-dependent hydrolase